MPPSFLEASWEKLAIFWKAYKKAYSDYLIVIVKGSESKDLAAVVLSIPKISKDSIKKSNHSLQKTALFTLFPRISRNIK